MRFYIHTTPFWGFQLLNIHQLFPVFPVFVYGDLASSFKLFSLPWGSAPQGRFTAENPHLSSPIDTLNTPQFPSPRYLKTFCSGPTIMKVFKWGKAGNPSIWSGKLVPEDKEVKLKKCHHKLVKFIGFIVLVTGSHCQSVAKSPLVTDSLCHHGCYHRATALVAYPGNCSCGAKSQCKFC